ncbi:nodal homolog 2-A-like [Bombina bombina]|uniref:nodal homolog 2-A-like n=1 Tax=Bombina bombina TaxID=8345 RepID=UPI00235A5CFC|nr:nodal homolog 2-A-like [Bombina bombina]
MELQNIILGLLVLSLVEGMPSLTDIKQARSPLPGYILGLKASTTLHGTRHSHGMKYPLCMMQLYQNLILRNNPDHPNPEHSVLQESDAVLSLIAKDYSSVDNHWALSFDMSSISNSIDLKLAELRINLPTFEKYKAVKVDIYHTKDGEEKIFLGTFITNPSTTMSAWKVFNLTKMITFYLHEEKFYSHEYIKAEGMPETFQHIYREKEENREHNVDLNHNSFFTGERVILVVFAKDRQSDNVSDSSNLIKMVESSKYVSAQKLTTMHGIRRHRRNRHEQQNIMVNNIQHKRVEDGKPLCQKVDMIVDFEKIGWDDQIIHPKTFNAYRCEGACPIPVNEAFKPTNHAFIKSLLKLYGNDEVECPSCVPVKMRPMSILHNEGGEAVIRHHEDMIVEECGCL